MKQTASLNRFSDFDFAEKHEQNHLTSLLKKLMKDDTLEECFNFAVSFRQACVC